MYNKTLCELKVGEKGRVRSSHLHGNLRQRLLDMGLIENTVVECVGKSPCGDPSAFLIRGAVIALRNADSRYIILKPLQ